MFPNMKLMSGPMPATAAAVAGKKKNYFTNWIKAKHENLSRHSVRWRRHPFMAIVAGSIAQAIVAPRYQ
jgi:hypothetical protein